MAGKPRPMSQIKQLLQLHEQGKGIKFIARSLGISKNTVKAYLAKVALLPLDVQALLALDDPIMVTQPTRMIVSSILKRIWNTFQKSLAGLG
jgi:hypothetical protein